MRVCIRGLKAITEQMESDRLQVNRSKSAIVAAPSSHREELEELMAGWKEWSRGGLLVLSDEEISADLLEVIVARVGAQGSRIQTGTLDLLHWSKAGKASVTALHQ